VTVSARRYRQRREAHDLDVILTTVGRWTLNTFPKRPRHWQGVSRCCPRHVLKPHSLFPAYRGFRRPEVTMTVEEQMTRTATMRSIRLLLRPVFLSVPESSSLVPSSPGLIRMWVNKR
jgi:hypothetical protein